MPRGRFSKANKKKLSKYKTDPAKANLAVLARRKDKLVELKVQHDVLKLVKAGNTFDEVSQKLGIDPKEALEQTKAAIDRWGGELSLDAEQNRQLDLKREDAMLLLLWNQAQPKPLFRKDGRPVLDYETGEQVMGPVDLEAIKVWQQIMDRRAKLLGLNPAESAITVNNQVNIVERIYRGANPDDL